MRQTVSIEMPAYSGTPANILMGTTTLVQLSDLSVNNEVKFNQFTFGPFARPFVPYVAPGIYPPVGKVRTPEGYGPTGVEYTGTETLPVAAQVESGIKYGANGTEFTGTLVPGTGGGGRRKRVTW